MEMIAIILLLVTSDSIIISPNQDIDMVKYGADDGRLITRRTSGSSP